MQAAQRLSRPSPDGIVDWSQEGDRATARRSRVRVAALDADSRRAHRHRACPRPRGPCPGGPSTAITPCPGRPRRRPSRRSMGLAPRSTAPGSRRIAAEADVCTPTTCSTWAPAPARRRGHCWPPGARVVAVALHRGRLDRAAARMAGASARLTVGRAGTRPICACPATAPGGRRSPPSPAPSALVGPLQAPGSPARVAADLGRARAAGAALSRGPGAGVGPRGAAGYDVADRPRTSPVCAAVRQPRAGRLGACSA